MPDRDDCRQRVMPEINFREIFPDMIHGFGQFNLIGNERIQRFETCYRIQQALKQLRTDLKDYLPLLLPILFP